MDPSLCSRKQMPEHGMETLASPLKKKFKTQPSAGNVVLTLFWM
jgi:hypothetical protein